MTDKQHPRNRHRADKSELDLNQPAMSLPTGLILQFLAMSLVTLLLLSLAPDLPLSLRLLFVAVILLTLKRLGGLAILVTMQADLALREGRSVVSMGGFSGLLLVIVVLGIVMLVFRQRLLLRRLSATSVAEMTRTMLTGSAESDERFATGSQSGPKHMTASVMSAVAQLLMCVIAARLLLYLLPRNRQLSGHLRNWISADPALESGAWILWTILVAGLILMEWSWRRLTPPQARMYLRSVFLKQHFRDLGMVVVRRIRDRRKRALAEKSTRP